MYQNKTNMAITKETCRNLRTDLDAALAVIKAKYNLDINVGNMGFTQSSISVKLECALLTSGVESVEQSNFNQYAIYYGFKVEDFGKEFRDARGDIHRIVGIKPRSKYPVLTKNVTKTGTAGTTATNKWTLQSVKSLIG